MNCQRCDQPAHTRDHCEKHYRYLLNTGRFADYARVDAEPVREHLRALKGLHWTVEAIGDASGVSMAHAASLARGEYRTVRGDTAKKILAVPLVESASHHGIHPAGTMRRIQALAWMGWPAKQIASRVGVKKETIYTLSHRGGGRGRVSSRLAWRIAEVYEELSGVRGPERQSATKARASGFAPPLAWDDETIDDPRARPRGLRRSA